MAKAKSKKSSGLREYVNPDKGTTVDKLKNRNRDIDSAVDKATKKTKKAATGSAYTSGSNSRMKTDADKLRSKSKSEIEAIRKKLQAGKKVKAG